MLAQETVPNGWRAALAPVLAPVLASPQTVRLAEFLAAEEAASKTIYPPRGLRLAALDLTPLDRVKVVILGQDPYHGPGQAHGLSFSVPDGIKPPPSLANLFKELHADLGLPRPASGNLTRWAAQGVLLLNTVLSVEQGRPGSHRGRGWEHVTGAVLAAVAAKPDPCVFLLWGSHAQQHALSVTGLSASGLTGTHHLILTAPHPSPLSAHRGFLGCRHFSQANAFLTARGRGAVDWRT